MIYLISHSEKIDTIFQKELEDSSSFIAVEEDFYLFDTTISDQDILILDVDRFDSLERLIYYFIKLPKRLNVVAITTTPHSFRGAFLIKKGFKSYLGTDTEKSIIETALQSVANGNVWLYPQLMNFIIQQINIDTKEFSTEVIFEKLTQKEQEVAMFVSDGLSNKEIAKKLEVQLVTVKKHIGHIFTKLDVKDRLSLALLVHQ